MAFTSAAVAILRQVKWSADVKSTIEMWQLLRFGYPPERRDFQRCATIFRRWLSVFNSAWIASPAWRATFSTSCLPLLDGTAHKFRSAYFDCACDTGAKTRLTRWVGRN